MHREELRQLGLNGRRYFDRHFERLTVISQLEEWIST
jgi:hypothetical protein